MSLAATLRTLRAEKKLTLQEVADKLGVSKPHVWELEKGKSKNPSADTLLKLSELFKVPIDTLLNNNVDSETSPEAAALLRTVDSAGLSKEEFEIVQQAVDFALRALKANKKDEGSE